MQKSQSGDKAPDGLINTVGCCASKTGLPPTLNSGMLTVFLALLIYYDGLKIPQKMLIDHLVKLESELGDLSTSRVPSRLFKLPIIFDHPKQDAALTRYMETQRPYASYLPDNMDFVAKNNGLSVQELKDIFTKSSLIAVSVGFFAALPLCLPIDPRQRINCPKVSTCPAPKHTLFCPFTPTYPAKSDSRPQMNPSRVFTPEGQVSWGGSCMALYNIESPGGYQLTGLTIPGCDILGSKNHYSLQRPWLFEDFDQLTFYEVSQQEYERQLALFKSGRYDYEVKDVVFDMAEHNKLLQETRGEVEVVKEKQAEAQMEMQKKEEELMARWTAEKAKGKIPVDKVEALLSDPGIEKVASPLNANVWKVVAEEGADVEGGDVVAVLEAMKLEIAVEVEEGTRGTVERLLVRPGDVCAAGDPLVLVRKR